MKEKNYEIDSKQYYNNQVFLKKLKTIKCKNIKAVKKYYY